MVKCAKLCYGLSMQIPSKQYLKKHWRPLALVVLLLVTLPLSIPLAQHAWEWVTGASYQAAAIVVDTSHQNGPVRPIWMGVAQGFEKKEGEDFRLTATVPYMRAVGVKYVRIDHLYDGYGVVSRGADGRLTYNWTKLDAMVSDIVSAGATPYFSLSYMPDVISHSDILDYPNNWNEWGQVVGATVAHYSRDYRGGLPNVIYEVWNEPDLFGGWKASYTDKNYQQLYSVASNAAVSVRGAKPFQIGGPATTGFYTSWVDGFYNKLDSTVRIDFFSWHRYSTDVQQFVSDVQQAQQLIAPKISKAQSIYISESGVSSDKGSQYDGRWAAAHYLAVNLALENSVADMVMPFEVMDDANGQTQFHGGWGMLTNPAYGAVVPKPRYRAMQLLSQMTGMQLPHVGDGTYVTALAARDPSGVIRVLAVNYDPSGTHQEIFPLALANLADGVYTVQEQYLSGRTVSNDISISSGVALQRQIVLTSSDAVLVTVTKR